MGSGDRLRSVTSVIWYRSCALPEGGDFWNEKLWLRSRIGSDAEAGDIAFDGFQRSCSGLGPNHERGDLQTGNSAINAKNTGVFS